METKCVCFFDKDGSITKDMKLTAGDDATDCHWMTADLDDPGFKLYASHRDFLKLAIDKVKSEMKTLSPNKTTAISKPKLVAEPESKTVLKGNVSKTNATKDIKLSSNKTTEISRPKLVAEPENKTVLKGNVSKTNATKDGVPTR